MVTEVNCSDHFTTYADIGSLYCIPETNINVYVNYASIKNT